MNIHLNERANGVYLPQSAEAAYRSLGPYHPPLTARGYFQALWNRLRQFENASPDVIRDELQRVAHELVEGRFYP
jgi:hypothetical protein